MSNQWYVTRDDKIQFGPFSDDQLQKLIRLGKLTPKTQVAKNKDGPWVPAARVKGLFPAAQPPPAPPMAQAAPLVEVILVGASNEQPPVRGVEPAQRTPISGKKLLIVLGIPLLTLLVLGCCLTPFVTLKNSVNNAGEGSRNNAKCLVCRHEFMIPELHRGTIAATMREYRCPNCDYSLPASILYQGMDNKKK